jgi:hypothetical protein
MHNRRTVVSLIKELRGEIKVGRIIGYRLITVHDEVLGNPQRSTERV